MLISCHNSNCVGSRRRFVSKHRRRRGRSVIKLCCVGVQLSLKQRMYVSGDLSPKSAFRKHVPSRIRRRKRDTKTTLWCLLRVLANKTSVVLHLHTTRCTANLVPRVDWIPIHGAVISQRWYGSYNGTVVAKPTHLDQVQASIGVCLSLIRLTTRRELHDRCISNSLQQQSEEPQLKPLFLSCSTNTTAVYRIHLLSVTCCYGWPYEAPVFAVTAC